MDCKNIKDRLLDLASGPASDPEIERHVQSCDTCAEELSALIQTMTVMDEWTAPEPSPYFDARLRARLREETAQPARSWLDWVRKPALAVAMVSLMTVGISLYEHETPAGSANQQSPNAVKVQPGSAVSDLQSLDKNHELFANFDLLDDMDQDAAGQDANP
jgi:anti-sigma factor RsiW